MPLVITKVQTGVYAIRNTINGKVYIGSTTKTFKTRWQEHRNQLRGNRHYNSYLQHAWNKYGEENFEFEIIQQCYVFNCTKCEQKWIDHYQACNREYGYNRRPKAENNLGIKFGPLTEEHKKKIGQALKGKPNPAVYSEEARNRMGEAMRGKKFSPEALAKRSVSRRANKTPYSEEVRKRMSESAKKRGISQETRDKIKAAIRTPESLKRRAETMSQTKRRKSLIEVGGSECKK